MDFFNQDVSISPSSMATHFYTGHEIIKDHVGGCRSCSCSKPPPAAGTVDTAFFKMNRFFLAIENVLEHFIRFRHLY